MVQVDGWDMQKLERGSENTHIHKNPKPKNKKTPPHNNKQNNKKPPKKLGPEMPAEERDQDGALEHNAASCDDWIWLLAFFLQS